MNNRQLLRRISDGAVANVRFTDLTSLLEAMGFVLARVRGSHHIFMHPASPELVNIQDVRGQAKPYQVRQVAQLIERYNLRLEDTP